MIRTLNAKVNAVENFVFLKNLAAKDKDFHKFILAFLSFTGSYSSTSFLLGTKPLPNCSIFLMFPACKLAFIVIKSSWLISLQYGKF